MATGNGAEKADGGKEWSSCRAQGVSIMVTEGGGVQTRAEGMGGNEAGRDGSVWPSSC